MTEKWFNNGDIVFRQGDFGDTFYQIAKGSVRIMLDNEDGDPIVLTELSDGDFFGEMAVIDVYPRSATAVVISDGTKLLEFPGKEIDHYFTGDPDQAVALINHLGARLRTLTNEYADVKSLIGELKQSAPQSEGLLARIRRFLSFPVRGDLSRPTAEERRIASHSEGYAGRVESWPAGTVIFREGDEASCMYDIHYGSVGIYTAYGTESEKKLAELGTNQFFGEMGLVSHEPRSATAVALTDNTALEIIDTDELRTLGEKNPLKVWMIISHLSKRLRTLTRDFMDACEEVRRLQS